MDSTELRTSEPLRQLSTSAFNSAYRVEIGLAIPQLEETFVFEDLWELLVDVCQQSDIEPPSQSKVREELRRLRQDLGVLERLPRVRGSLIQREIRKPSPFWELCHHLSDRVGTR